MKKNTRTMKDSRHIDGFNLGSKLKGAWSKLSPEAQGTTISFHDSMPWVKKSK
jgi:hypothetical protein